MTLLSVPHHTTYLRRFAFKEAMYLITMS